MRRALGLGLVVFLISVSTSGAAPAPEKALPAPSVDKLIEQLGDPDFKLRDEAMKLLEGLGHEILPQLRRAKTHDDPEVRRRVAILLPAKEMSAILSPKRVTLPAGNRTPRQAIAEICKQTSYKIDIWPEAQFNGDREKQTFPFQFDNVPFWEAVDRICADGGLAFQTGYGNEVLRLHYQDSRPPYVYRDGPFRVVATGFHYSKSIDFSGIPRAPSNNIGNRSEYLNLSFSLTVEPKLPLLGIGQARLIEARDDRNNSMGPPQNSAVNGSTSISGYYRSYTQQTQVNLLWPAKDAQVVKYLRGSVPVQLLIEQKPAIVVEKIAEAKGKKIEEGNTQLTISEIKDTPNGAGKLYHIKMTLRDNRKDIPNDYTWSNSLNQRLELVDAKGNKYMSHGWNSLSTTPNSVDGTFMFGDPGNGQVGPAVKLIYYSWTTMQHHVTFEFRDLPLP